MTHVTLPLLPFGAGLDNGPRPAQRETQLAILNFNRTPQTILIRVFPYSLHYTLISFVLLACRAWARRGACIRFFYRERGSAIATGTGRARFYDESNQKSRTGEPCHASMSMV